MDFSCAEPAAMAFGPNDRALEQVQHDLGYNFQDKWLLRQVRFLLHIWIAELPIAFIC